MFESLKNRLVGPILDVLGSKSRDVKTVNGQTVTELIDRDTDEVIGYEYYVAGDGNVVLRNFGKPTTLRKKILQESQQKENKL